MAALRSLFARSTGSLGMIGPLVANPGCSVSSQDLSLQTVDLLGARNLLIHNSIKHDPSLVVPEQTEELPSTSYVRGAAELPGVSSTKEVDALCLNLDGVVVPSPVYVNGWGPKLCGLSCAVRGDSFWLDQFSDCEVRKMLKKLEPAYLQKVYALKTKEQEFEALEKLYAVTRTELKQSQFELYNAQFLYQQKLYAFNTKSENLKAKEQAVESQEVRNAVISRDLKQLQLEMHQRDLAYGRQLARDCMVEQVLGKLNALCDAVERQEPAVTVCKFVEKVEEDSVSMKRRELSLMSKSSTKLSCKVYYICMSKFFPDGFSGSMLRFLGRFGRFLVFINTTYKFLASYAIMVGGGYVWYHTAMNKEDISDYIDKKLTDMQATLLKELEDHRAQKGKKELEEVPRKATDPDDAEDIRDFIVQKLTDMHATLLKQLEDHLAQKDKKELEEVPRKATDPDDAEDIRDFIVQKLTDMHATLLKQLEDHLAQKGEKELEGQVPRKARVADDLGKVKARVADDLGKVKKSEDAE